MKIAKLGFTVLVGLFFLSCAFAPASALQGPTVVISSPANNALYETGVSIYFDGSQSTGSPVYNYTYPITSYKWTFGDGQTATTACANHSYAKAGKYNVTLTIIDYSQASASKSIVLNIAPPAAPQNVPNQPMTGGKLFNPILGGIVFMNAGPTATISAPANNAFYETGVMISFDGSQSVGGPSYYNQTYPITNYKWTFGDGQTATGAKVNHSYAKGGKYDVTLSIVDAAQGTASKTIVLLIAPPAQPQNVPNQPLGSGKLFNPITGGMVFLSMGPSAVITAPANKAFFETGVNISFDGSGSSGNNQSYIVKYTWVFGDGATLTGVKVTHAYVKAGAYTVKLTVEDYYQQTGTATILLYISPPASPQNIPNQPLGGGKLFNPMGGMVMMNAGPTAVITSPANNDCFDMNVSIKFDGSRSTGQGGGQGQNGSYITTWKWTFGDGQTASGSVVNHIYMKGGRFTVTLTVTDSWGVQASTSITVLVSPPAAPQDMSNQPTNMGGFHPVIKGGMLIL